MKMKIIYCVSVAAVLTGCETLQTPQQRQQAAAREQAATRHTEERFHRVQGQVESIEMENARLVQEFQRLQNEVRSCNAQMAQFNSAMQTLEAKQASEMAELIRRVEALLKKSAASRPAPSRSSRGAGREHVVEAGHTLSAIAQAYGTTVKAIKQANNLSSDSIYVGQKLFIPE